MAVASRKEFVACVAKSNVVPTDKLKAWLSVVDDEDPKKVAAKLVRDQLLTPWQAKFLLSGRSRLSVGNYLLQTRVARDELGDKFEAIHSQLNRKVIIQVFPSELSEKQALLPRLLTKLRQITELDHPNLVHVYDVDQESTRYFLVTEFVDGTTLDLISPKDLSDSAIAVIIQGIASGLAHAHTAGIIHGSVTTENIIVTPDGKAELQGFPSGTVNGTVDAANFTAGHDMQQLGAIGETLLKELPESLRSEEFESFKSMIIGLKDQAQRDASLQMLDDWIAARSFADAAASATLIQSSEYSTIGPETSAGDSVFDPTTASPTMNEFEKNQPIGDSTDAAPNGFLETMWHDKRVTFLAALAGIFLVAAGTIGALGYAFSVGTAPDNQVVVSKDNSRKKTNRPKNTLNAPLAVGNTAEGLLAGKRDLKPGDDALDPEANRKKIAEFFAGRDVVETGKKTGRKKWKKSKSKKPDSAAPTPPVLPRPRDTKSTQAKSTQAKPPKIARSNRSTSNSADLQTNRTKPTPSGAAAVSSQTVNPGKNTQRPETKKSAKSKSKTKPSPPSTISKPFKTLVQQTDLPETADISDFKIADLTIASHQLLGLDLLAEPAIARNKIGFQLNRSASDKQLWDVELSQKRGAPIAVAQFQKTPTEFKFRWLPSAVKNDNANYLRNCKLKLSVPKDSAWLGLRSPILIDDFSFSGDKATIKVETELNWLPNPTEIKIELQTFKIGGRDDKVSFTPREITKRGPGRIFFRDNESERFFFINVTADIRKKTRLQAQMMVLLPNGAPQPLRSTNDLAEFANAIGMKKTEADYQYEQSKIAKKPKNMETQEFNRLKDEAESNAKRLGKMFELSKNYFDLGKLLSKQIIPLVIYFDMNGHRIVIAESIAKK